MKNILKKQINVLQDLTNHLENMSFKIKGNVITNENFQFLNDKVNELLNSFNPSNQNNPEYPQLPQQPVYNDVTALTYSISAYTNQPLDIFIQPFIPEGFQDVVLQLTFPNGSYGRTHFYEKVTETKQYRQWKIHLDQIGGEDIISILQNNAIGRTPYCIYVTDHPTKEWHELTGYIDITFLPSRTPLYTDIEVSAELIPNTCANADGDFHGINPPPSVNYTYRYMGRDKTWQKYYFIPYEYPYGYYCIWYNYGSSDYDSEKYQWRLEFKSKNWKYQKSHEIVFVGQNITSEKAAAIPNSLQSGQAYMVDCYNWKNISVKTGNAKGSIQTTDYDKLIIDGNYTKCNGVYRRITDTPEAQLLTNGFQNQIWLHQSANYYIINDHSSDKRWIIEKIIDNEDPENNNLYSTGSYKNPQTNTINGPWNNIDNNNPQYWQLGQTTIELLIELI